MTLESSTVVGHLPMPDVGTALEYISPCWYEENWPILASSLADFGLPHRWRAESKAKTPCFFWFFSC